MLSTFRVLNNSVCLIAISIVAFGSSSAIAQTSSPVDANDYRNDEIIVTAQKREQSLQDVGLSVTAAPASTLKELGIKNTGDLAKITPGLTFTKSQDGTPLYTLRGVGFNDYTLGASPAVSVYVDQVPLAYGAFTKGATLDLERVEVLKGPQGILFGQNSTGGAINYIAAKPTESMEAGFSASYGRFDTLEAETYISGPLADTLGFRIALATTQAGDWQENYTREEQLGREDSLRGRLQLEWQPTDRFNLLLSANGWRDKSDTQAGQFQGLFLQIDEAAVAAGGLFDVPETSRRIDVFRDLPSAPDNARAADWDNDRDLSRDDDFFQLSARADYELTDAITATSITSFSKYSEKYSVDRDGTSLKGAGVNADGSVDTFTQEVRLSGDTDRLNWLVGANYATNDVISANDILTGDSTNTAILAGGPFIRESTTTITQDIEEYAVFGNLEYQLNDKLSVLGGARYTKTTNDFTSCMRGDIGMQASFTFLARVFNNDFTLPAAGPQDCLNLDQNTFRNIITPYEETLKEDNVSWRAGVNYKANEDTLLYGLVSRGYKSGSFPTIPASTTAQFAPVTQESVTAYEVGAKLSLMDRLLQLNVAGFHYQYDDKQVRGLIVDPVFNQLEQLVNVPESEINGAEAELTIRPTKGLTILGAATYVDTEVKEFTGINNERVFDDYSGSALPFSPKWHLLANVNYEWDLSQNYGGFVGSNILHNSKTSSTLGDAPSSVIDNFTTVDVRAGITSFDNGWRFSLWARNVFDEEYWTNQFVTQDVIVRYNAKPATYGATFSVDFN